jgi:hypothetical protein
LSANPSFKPVYIIVVIGLWLTGMAQMPIMKRYYIADLPGLGWLADFYATHLIHYIGASLLLFILVYAAIVYLAVDRKRFQLTLLAMVRIVILLGLVISGIFRVWKNLPDVVFTPNFILAVDLVHIALAMALMLAGLVALITRSRWLKEQGRT